MKTRLQALLMAMIPAVGMFASDDSKMDAFIDSLMSQMTLDEKIGQMNLPPSDDIVTGSPMSSNIGAAVAEGHVGGTFNIKGAAKIAALQHIAVEKAASAYLLSSAWM